VILFCVECCEPQDERDGRSCNRCGRPVKGGFGMSHDEYARVRTRLGASEAGSQLYLQRVTPLFAQTYIPPIGIRSVYLFTGV
jgi:hypothetical protein